MKNLKRGLKGLFMIALAASRGYSQSPLSAREVVAKMADVYAHCNTYRDEGKVITQTGRTVTFITAFQRPASFRFEYFTTPRLQTVEQYVVWRNKPGDAQMWWTIRPHVETKPMPLAIASVTGVSSGSGHNIPRLLMPDEVTGFSLAGNWMSEALPVEEIVDGHASYKITGHYEIGPGETLSVWIDKQSLLIRKLQNKRETVTYSPEINVPVDASLFEFHPR
jgi:hypothetical protein